MNAKHTPGPWSWQPQGNNKHILPRHYKLNAFTGKGLAVTVLESEDEVWPKHPDARLIASAPDLLAALKAIHERDKLAVIELAKIMPGYQPSDEAASCMACAAAAIAKAEGRAE